MRHYNKREKTANWLFKIAEYVAIALGINALLPNSPLTTKNVIIGTIILLVILILALWITPEKQR
jgi:Mn2+/Fe2+ NRAMP family transporter